ncbi:uncharacterized protein LOC129945776 [Eupeodes corollae]|uniref:uncharacterized protein LOC129945776 n=1 Tax=Eupeodes corollae TaxID=290404 RepID=UPI0024904997|nr:uncharacterized protein LOC129945776 [Eupeodes corollae]
MSISLDVSFLSSEGFSIKPPATIFDEIEGLFAADKDFSPNVPLYNDAASAGEKLDSHFLKPQRDTASSSLHDAKSCDIPSLVSSDFLLNEEAHEDQQLFMVEPYGLKPITSPFMVPGIYKRIPHTTRIEPEQPADKVTSKNVFICSTEKTGKILAASVFKDAYINLEEEALEPEPISPEVKKPVAPQVPDSLTMLAYDILKLSNRDNIVIDRERNEIIRHEGELNRKTIYRFLTPKTLGLSSEMLASLLQNESHREIMPPVKSKRGRPRKNKEPGKPPPPTSSQSVPQPPEKSQPKVTSPVKVQRTRSGRIVKSALEPPPTRPPEPDPEPDNAEPENAASFMRNFLRDLKDSEYETKSSPPPPTLPESPVRPKTRNLSADSYCPTCNKIFLGKRMQHHFQAFPDHRPNTDRQKILEEMSLFKFLVGKVQNTSQDQRADVFLNEISDLVEQLQARSSRMIRNTSGLQFVNSKTSKVLGIPEGHYSLDVNSIDAPPDPIVHFENLAPPPVIVPRLDYNLSMSLDDTSTEAKMHLSGAIASEESLLRTVDDLMKEGMKKLDHDLLHPAEPQVIHYDHGSDNAVEAVSMKETSQGTPILDLSLDLFQFNSN